MKSKLYKVFIAFVMMAMVVDWPVTADAQRGRAVQKAGKSLLQGCSKSSKSHPNLGTVGAASNRVTRSAAKNNDQSTKCSKCLGTGQILYDGEYYYCPDCNGTGRKNR